MILSLLLVIVQAEWNEWLSEWEKVGLHIGQRWIPNDERNDYGKMAAYSGIGLNHLGYYERCVNVDIANYVQLCPMPNGCLTFWGPAACKEADYLRIIHSAPVGDEASEVRQFMLGSAVSDILAGIRVIFPHSQARSYFGEMAEGQFIMGTLAVLLFVICVLTSIYDWHLREKDEDPNTYSTKTKTILAFSLYSNYKRLFATPATFKPGDPMNIVSFVWVVSWIWNNYFNYVYNRIRNGYIVNLIEFHIDSEEIFPVIGYAGVLGTDGIFLVIALSTTYLFLSQINANRDFSVLKLYFRRFFAFYPMYLFLFFFIWAFLPFTNSGPHWWAIQDSVKDCKEYWWANLIFVNNFLPSWKTTDCLNWTWFFDLMVVYFILTIPVLLIYHHCTRISAWIWAFGLMITCVLVSAKLTDYHDYHVALGAPQNLPTFWYYYYYKPYTRWAAWGFGIICGLILFSYRNYEETSEKYDKVAWKLGDLVVNNGWFRWCWIIFGVASYNAAIWLKYPAYRDATLEWDNLTKDERIAYLSLNRFWFAWGLSCVLMPIYLGHFPLLREYMSSSFFVPMARLGTTVLMLNMAVAQYLALGQKQPYYFDGLDNVKGGLICGVYTWVLALPAYLITQAPINQLMRNYFEVKTPPEFLESWKVNKSAEPSIISSPRSN